MFRKMDSEIQNNSVTQIINFTGYADVVYVAIGAANNVEQQFPSIICRIAITNRLVIKIVLIDPLIEQIPVCIKKFPPLALNRYGESDVFILTCNSIIRYHHYNSNRLIMELLKQLKRKKKRFPHKTNLLFIQDFSETDNLTRHVTATKHYCKVSSNVAAGSHDSSLFYVTRTKVELFSMDLVDNKDLTRYFAHTILRKQMINQVRKRISVIYRYYIPRWLDIFLYLAYPDTQTFDPNSFFAEQLDVTLLDNDFYRKRTMRSITDLLMVKTKETFEFLETSSILQRFYDFCTAVVSNPHMAYDAIPIMMNCCHLVVMQLQQFTKSPSSLNLSLAYDLYFYHNYEL